MNKAKRFYYEDTIYARFTTDNDTNYHRRDAKSTRRLNNKRKK